jgi:hypothetical protein
MRGDVMDEVQVLSLEEARVHIITLKKQVETLQRQVRMLDKENDTFLRTVWWRRWMFILDGWSGHRVVDAPAWRPWRRWWRS